jgi:signal transduction histidine kinase
MQIVNNIKHDNDDDNKASHHHENMCNFINENEIQIVKEWETFARTLTPATHAMTSLALRDHIHEIITFIVHDMGSSQSDAEQVQKSHGEKEESSTPSAAETHAALRLIDGFNIDQMVSEYRALRASVVKLWRNANKQITVTDLDDLTRFNEAIDQALAESVSHYTKQVDYSKDLFIGILSHDLRTPLNVISMSAQLMKNIGGLNEQSTMLANQVSESTSRIAKIVDDLLDVTKARFGSGLPASCAPMDMGVVTHQIIAEMRAAYPSRSILLDVAGDVKGEWDKVRIGQLLCNLINNAHQYGFRETPISVKVKGESKMVVISVHNDGVAIPPEKMSSLFYCLVRGDTGHEGHPPETVNLGLGLYITKEIVIAHGGTIDVASTEDGGTTFTAHLPRSPVEIKLQPVPPRPA